MKKISTLFKKDPNDLSRVINEINPENLTEHVLLRHGSQTIAITKEEITFNKLKEFLTALPIEGIVFHHQDGRMCKLRKSDYGIKR